MKTFKQFSSFLTEGVNDPGIFKAIFLAGGPGSGKSFIVKRTALQAMGLVLINSDTAFEHIMRKQGLDFKMPDSEKEQRDLVRNTAKATIDKKLELALEGRLGVVIDGTGKDFDKIQKARNNLAALGYECGMIFVNTDLDTAKKRNLQRARSVKDELVTKMWNEVQRNLGKFHQLFGNNFYLVDNSEGHEFEPQVNNVFKKISAWSKTTPATPLAKKWIASQSKKRINENSLNAQEIELDTIEEVVSIKEVEKLKSQWNNVDKLNVNSSEWQIVKNYLDKLTSKDLHTIVMAKIKFVSPAANVIYARRNMRKMGQDIIENKDDKDPCWDGYKMVGMKKKNGKKVPNCVKDDSVE